MVEKCTGWSRILAQDKVIWGKGWYVKQDGKQQQQQQQILNLEFSEG